MNDLCNKFPHLSKNWIDFIGGTMFWISNDALSQLTDGLINYISEKVSYGKPPSNFDEKIHIEYICERLFTGVMCYDKTNILINDYTPPERNFEVKDGEVKDSYFYSPKVFSIYQPKNIIFH
jgi:hypothetical protein